MSIPNYVRPQHTIRQLLDQTADATVSRISAIAVGTQYLLARYGEEDLPATAFNSAGQTLTWQYIDSDGVTQTATGANVDQDSVRLYAEDLEAEICATTHNAVTVAKADPNVIILGTNNFSGGTLDEHLLGRAVQVGDIVQVTAPAGANYKRTVTALRGATVAAHVGTNTGLDDTYFANSALNPSTLAAAAVTGATSGLTVTSAAAFSVKENYSRGPLYNGYFGDQFYLTVTGYGVGPDTMKVRVSSASGLYASAELISGTYGAGAYVFAANAETGNLEITVTCATQAHAAGTVLTFVVKGDYLRIGTGANARIATTGTYTGTRSTKIVARVTGTNTNTNTAIGAKIWVSDTAGLLTPQEYTLDGSAQAAIGLGLTVTFDIDAADDLTYLRVGDIFYLEAVADSESTTLFNRLVLDGPAIDTTVNTGTTTTLTGISIRQAYSGEIEATSASDDSAWTSDSTGLIVQAALSYYESERDTGQKWLPFVTGVGNLYAGFRAIVSPTATEGVIAVDTAADCEQFGTDDPDNDLGYGIRIMLAAAQGNRVYALRTGGDTAALYEAALAKAEATDMVYAFGILSNLTSVFDAVKTHVLAMSTETQRKFRRAYVSTESPGEYAKITEDEDGDPLAVAISGTSLVANGTAPATAFNGTDVLAAGDKVRVFGGGGTYDEYVIASVDSATQLTLVSGPANPLDGVTVEIWKADTPASQAAYVRGISRGLGTRRMANIWVENPTKVIDGVTTSIPVKFVACEVAGIRSALLPQQGLTRTEITAITDASAMYTRYSQTLLDEVAADGTFIITQDMESGTVYIRHQLTTDSSNGSLYYEDSVGVNLDNISFIIKDDLDGYIGRYNVTPATVDEIKNKVWHALDLQTRALYGSYVGPALISFEDLSVAVDSVLKDRINVYAQLVMPLPLNNIVTTLRASVDVNL